MTDFKNKKLEVQFNRSIMGKVPQGQFGKYMKHFRREETTAHGLAIEIWRGWGFATVWEGRRLKENFISVQHLALDFDTEDVNSHMDTLFNDEHFQDCGAFAYSTASSKPNAPRTRLVFVLESPMVVPMTDNDEGQAEEEEARRAAIYRYETLYKAMLEIYPHADTAAKDINRIFYGAYKCEVRGNWSMMGDAYIDQLVTNYERNNPAYEPQPQLPVVTISGGDNSYYIKAAVKNEADIVASTPSGQRHHAIVKAAAALGNFVGGGGLDYNEAYNALLSACAGWANQESIIKTINDGLKTGAATPRTVPPRQVELYAV